MKTICVNETNLNIIQQTAPSCVIALGFFDGLHLGHQKVIETAKAEAKRRKLPLALMSFPLHPSNVLSRGKKNVGNLMTLSNKQEKLKKLGVDLFYLVSFTNDFANLKPNEFVKQYLLNLGVKHAVAGFDYCYGNKGLGKLVDIPAYSDNNISITEVECTVYKKEKISSTAIRYRLQQGLVHEIPNFLGHPYRNKAKVENQNLTILEDTILPVYGQYHILLEQNEKKFYSKVIVKPNDEVQCLQFPEIQGEVFIEWLVYIAPFQVTNIV